MSFMRVTIALIMSLLLLTPLVSDTITIATTLENRDTQYSRLTASKSSKAPYEITYIIAASEDDAMAWYNSADNVWGATSSNAFDAFGNASGTQYRGYLRFQLTDIPKGSIIHSAYLNVTSYFNNPETFIVNLRLIDSDDCPPFTDLADLYNRSVTSSSVRWDLTAWASAENYTSPNLALLVQEFIDRPNYVINNYIGLRLASDYPEAVSGEFKRYSTRDAGAPEYWPRLVISYTPPEEIPTTTVSIYNILDGYDDAHVRRIEVGPVFESDTESITFGFYDISTFTSRTYQRFQLNIPKGAIIVNATLKVIATDTESPIFTPTIKLLDNDSCDPFLVSPLDWNTTNGSVAWSLTSWVAEEEYTTPNLRVLVQEFIDRSGYEPNNYIGIRIDEGDLDKAEYGQGRYYASYENPTYLEPRLEIEYYTFALPDLPPYKPSGLGVQGFVAGQKGLLRIADHTPVLNWTFTDPNLGDYQVAFNCSVWNGSVGTGELMWYRNDTGSSTYVTYLEGGVIVSLNYELSDGYCYNLSVEVNDTTNMWNVSEPLMFRMNFKPSLSNLAVEGFYENSPRILNISDKYPIFNWSYSDNEDDLQARFNVSVWDDTKTILLWYKNATGENNTVTYNESGGAYDALPLENNENYYLNVKVSDGYEWSHLVEVIFRTNFTFYFKLEEGWNFITLPLYNETYQFASDLTNKIEHCWRVKRWNSLMQKFEIYTKGSLENDFELKNATGYFVWVNQTTYFTFIGYKLPSTALTLRKGWNSIGRFNLTTIKAEQLAQNIPGCKAVSYWDATLGRFILHPKRVQISNFDIKRGKGYFVWVENDITWLNE